MFNTKDETGVISEITPFLLKNPSISYIFTRDMVKPRWSESIDTACVVGSQGSFENIDFLMNKEFFSKLTTIEKFFVFAHETFHILFNHFKRGHDFYQNLPEKDRSRELMNIAMDITINDILKYQYFENEHSVMDIFQTAWTVETLSKKTGGNLILPMYKDFKFYYNEILQYMRNNPGSGEGGEGGIKMDSAGMNTYSDVLGDGAPSEASEKTHKETGSKTEENFNKSETEGEKQSSDNDTPKKKEVVTIYENMDLSDAINRYIMSKSLSATDFSVKPKTKYTWYGADRRNVNLRINTDIKTPIRNVTWKNKKIKLLIYCDVSGSVQSYTEKFINIVNTIDQSKVEIEFKVWASSVSPVTYNANNKAIWNNVGGGTTIENVIRDYKENYDDSMVDCVVVLTDGEYSNISQPKQRYVKTPTKWVFFMTQESKNVLDTSTAVVINW